MTIRYQRGNNVVTVAFYGLFAALLCRYVAAGAWPDLSRTVLTCGLSFVAVSLVRRALDRPRPYEKDPTLSPPAGKVKKGSSFPSRHVFSAFLIATVAADAHIAVAAVAYVAGAYLALCRVKLHHHSAADVLCGAILGIACGAVSLWLIA